MYRNIIFCSMLSPWKIAPICVYKCFAVCRCPLILEFVRFQLIIKIVVLLGNTKLTFFKIVFTVYHISIKNNDITLRVIIFP